jgi:hypothetical protein
MFVALTQVDFMFIRILADLIVNAHTTYYFLRGKIVNPTLYNEWQPQLSIGQCQFQFFVFRFGLLLYRFSLRLRQRSISSLKLSLR